MLYQNRFRRYSQRYFSVSRFCMTLAITRHISQVATVELDEDEIEIIDALRGTLGKKAKLRAFKALISTGQYSYDELLTLFPNYIP